MTVAVASSLHQMVREWQSFVAGDTTDSAADLARRYDGVLGPRLVQELSQDHPIDVVERIEAAAKELLSRRFRHEGDPEQIASAIDLSASIGMMLKYKPYGVKAASPLGYSLFFQEPGCGFSFQRHPELKTEVFHILDQQSGGFVFLCDYDDWRRVYDREAFDAWLAGEPDRRYDAFRYSPEPGDVIPIDRLGVVHSAIGCVLEEYATVSVDLVERLHNQNRLRTAPVHLSRERLAARLATLPHVEPQRIITRGADGWRTAAAPVERGSAGAVYRLATGDFHAARIVVHEGRRMLRPFVDDRAVSLFVCSGVGRLRIVGRSGQLLAAVRSLRPGTHVSVPPGVDYEVMSDGPRALVLAEHVISPTIAFATAGCVLEAT